jgi:hypothetical protein
MTGKIMPLRERDTSTVQAVAVAFVLAAVREPEYSPRLHRQFCALATRYR